MGEPGYRKRKPTLVEACKKPRVSSYRTVEILESWPTGVYGTVLCEFELNSHPKFWFCLYESLCISSLDFTGDVGCHNYGTKPKFYY